MRSCFRQLLAQLVRSIRRTESVRSSQIERSVNAVYSSQILESSLVLRIRAMTTMVAMVGKMTITITAVMETLRLWA